MRDLISELAEVHRRVAGDNADGDELVRVTMRRRYSTDTKDLWSALTEPDRIARWFMPVSGDLREGGSFQLEGNANGTSSLANPRRYCGQPSAGPTAS